MIEINQYIDKSWLPENGCTLETFKHLKLEPKKGTMYYYDALMSAKDQQTKDMLNAIKEGMKNGKMKVTLSDGSEIDLSDHSTWVDFQDLDEATQKLIKSQTEHLLKDLAEAVEKSRGTIPGEFAGILERINDLEEPKFDWRGYLRRFVGGSMNVYTKKLRRKFNKRFEENPGLKIKKKKHILVGIDTSGSVSNEELLEFMDQIDHIHNTGAEVTILQCDSAISHMESYKRGSEIHIHGRGGTSFDPIVEYYNENLNKYTCLIYLTDGEAPPPERPRGRMLWALSSKSKINPELPGHQILLN
jgi:predicted metal-dependent peptidase